MSSDTFDRISNNELSGFRAFVSGQIKMNGCLLTLKKFDKEVIMNPKYKIWRSMERQHPNHYIKITYFSQNLMN